MTSKGRILLIQRTDNPEWTELGGRTSAGAGRLSAHLLADTAQQFHGPCLLPDAYRVPGAAEQTLFTSYCSSAACYLGLVQTRAAG